MSAVGLDAGTAESRLERERRLRPRVAGLAVAAGVLLMLVAVLQMVGPHTKVTEATIDLIYADKRAGLDIFAAFVSAVGSVVIALVLLFLLEAAAARNEQVPGFIRIVTIVGAAIAAVSGVVYAIIIAGKAHTFATTGTQTYAEAHRLTSSGGLVALQLGGLLGALLVALAIVLVAVQAMRVGLLTRFMGYLGMFAGALVLFQITPLPIVETYWFLALAVLLVGRWPSGEPLAWRTGNAERWPSAQEAREQRIRAAGGAAAGQAGPGRRRGRRGAVEPPATTPEITPAPVARAPSSAQKRKRKRRR